MKNRLEAAEFARKQFDHLGSDYRCQREKGGQVHYGLQEVRELMDFIYEGEPASSAEEINFPEKS